MHYKLILIVALLCAQNCCLASDGEGDDPGQEDTLHTGGLTFADFKSMASEKSPASPMPRRRGSRNRSDSPQISRSFKVFNLAALAGEVSALPPFRRRGQRHLGAIEEEQDAQDRQVDIFRAREVQIVEGLEACLFFWSSERIEAFPVDEYKALLQWVPKGTTEPWVTINRVISMEISRHGIFKVATFNIDQLIPYSRQGFFKGRSTKAWFQGGERDPKLTCHSKVFWPLVACLETLENPLMEKPDGQAWLDIALTEENVRRAIVLEKLKIRKLKINDDLGVALSKLRHPNRWNFEQKLTHPIEMVLDACGSWERERWDEFPMDYYKYWLTTEVGVWKWITVERSATNLNVFTIIERRPSYEHRPERLVESDRRPYNWILDICPDDFDIKLTQQDRMRHANIEDEDDGDDGDTERKLVEEEFPVPYVVLASAKYPDNAGEAPEVRVYEGHALGLFAPLLDCMIVAHLPDVQKLSTESWLDKVLTRENMMTFFARLHVANKQNDTELWKRIPPYVEMFPEYDSDEFMTSESE